MNKIFTLKFNSLTTALLSALLLLILCSPSFVGAADIGADGAIIPRENPSVPAGTVNPPPSVPAGTVNPPPSVPGGQLSDPVIFQIPNPFGTGASSTLFDFVKRLIALALQIGIPFIILMIIYSGFLFVKARGQPEALGKAKDALLYTLIGAAVLLGATLIATAIDNTIRGLIR